MYNGYTETDEQAKYRLAARTLRHYELMYGENWEQDADALRAIIAEMPMQEYRAKRQRETQEWVAAGMPVQKYSSFGRCYHTPLSAEEANFYGLDE